MKLYMGVSSPFSRKARIVIREKGITSVEEVSVAPMEDPPELLAVNPLAQIPALLGDDGLMLAGSQMICRYLDESNGDPIFEPSDAKARWRVRSAEAVADGIAEMALKLARELRKPTAEQSVLWRDRFKANLERTIAHAAGLRLDAADLNHATIALAVALLYTELRLPDVDWRSRHDSLTQFVDRLSARPSFIDTAP